MLIISGRILKSINKSVGTYVLFVVIAIGLLAAASFLAGSQNTYSNEWDIAKQPERLTELYFTDHKVLPKKYVPGESADLSFTIHNLEAKPVTYSYEIIQQSDNTTQSLKTESITINNDVVHNETTSITYADTGARSRIIVRLVDQDQAIHYWVEQ